MGDRLGIRLDGSVLVLTLERPDRRNALDGALVDALAGALHEARRSTDVSAAVLTGSPPAFCAGGDLGDLPAGADAAILAERHRAFVALAQQIRTLPKPVVAAVNGAAVGAGAALALAADHVVIADDARLRLSFVAVGLPPDLLSVTLLCNRAGSAVAADLLYSGRPVDAAEAVRLHLADESAAPGDVVGAAVEAARRLGALPAFAFATTKLLLRHGGALGDVAGDFEPFLVGAAAASADFLDLAEAFRR